MRRPAPSSLVFAAVLLFSIPHASPSPSPFFPNCSQSFSCGSLQNISYPFTGGPRPVYCGPPGFRLRCTDDSFPELLSASTLSFRLLELNPVLQRMTLSRSDLYNSPCIHRFINTTLNPAVFYPYGPDNVNLTLFYGCAPASYKPMPIDIDSFSCSDDGSSGFYFVGPFPYPNEALRCNVSVTVPLSMIATDDLKTKNSSLQEVLTKGFVVTYRDLYAAECRQCRDSGGDCGFSGGPICICGDTLCQRTGSKTKTIVGLGLGIGAAAILLLCGWGSFMIHSKGRRKAAGSSSMDRGLPTSDASKTTKTPSLHLSDLTNISYPPYAFTNSDTGSTYFGAQVFSYLELVEATDTFNPCKELGDGGFGTVYFGVLRDGREVAVKRLYENTVKRVEQFLNEVEILTRLRHPNLVALYGCTSRHSRELLLVYEYVPNGTLADHLHGKLGAKGSLPWSVRLSVAIETANALAYLHASGTIHRDVKSTNILLDTNFHVKVADFGLSRLFPDDVTHVSTAPQGTPGYVDPEYYQIYQLTSKSDVYSFGVVLMELISAKAAVDMGRHRHDINLATMAIKRIQNHALHELVDPSLRFENDYAVRSMVTSVAELAFRCVQTQSEVRPSMEEVVEALQEIHKEELGAQKAEVVDIDMDMVLAKQIMSPPLSPDKVACSDMKRWLTRTI